MSCQEEATTVSLIQTTTKCTSPAITARQPIVRKGFEKSTPTVMGLTSMFARPQFPLKWSSAKRPLFPAASTPLMLTASSAPSQPAPASAWMFPTTAASHGRPAALVRKSRLPIRVRPSNGEPRSTARPPRRLFSVMLCFPTRRITRPVATTMPTSTWATRLQSPPLPPPSTGPKQVHPPRPLRWWLGTARVRNATVGAQV